MLRFAAAVLVGCTVLTGASNAWFIPSYPTPAVTDYYHDGVLHNSTKWNSLGVETTNDGATTNSLNGITWKDESGDGIIMVNEEVTFTVDLYKQCAGTHAYDIVKVWIGDEGAYDNVFTGTWKAEDWGAWGKDALVKNSKYFSFTHTFDTEGDYDILGRVTCSDDLSKIGGINKFTPVVDLFQGELEQYKLNVVAQNVPEPTMISLLGCGLLGLFLKRRRN